MLTALALAAALTAHQDAAPEDDSADWRAIEPENLLLIEMEGGTIAIELAEAFAPRTVEQMRNLARSGHYNEGASFYRVIENFVTQGGVLREVESEDEDAYDDGVPTVPAEYERDLGDLTFTPLGDPDLHAEQAGHVNGFQAAREGETVWLMHCYGAVAMARGNDPDSGSSHFYVINGHAPRYLDRNLTVWGRVIDGMGLVHQVHHGDRAVGGGVIPEVEDRTPILSVSLASEWPEDERPGFEVMRTDSEAFEDVKETLRDRTGEFWVVKERKAIEACRAPAPVRRAGGGDAGE